MSIVDTFTDTNNTEASLHSGEPGLGYTQPSYGSVGKSVIFNNQLTKDSSTLQAIYYRNDTPPADQRAAAFVRMLSLLSTNAAVVARLDPASDNYVWTRHNRDDGLWTIRETVNGSAGALTSVADTLNPGDERYVEMRCIGNQALSFVKKPDGTLLVLGPVTIAAAGGRIGWRFGGQASGSTGYAIDSLEGGAIKTPGTIAMPQFLTA